jgi:multidrug efflux pump subunit AcrA (membrane-fusion protein)
VAEIVETDQLNVLAWLPPRSARLVHVGQSAEVLIGPAAPVAEASNSEHDAHAEAESESESATEEAQEPEALEGKIEFVGQVADPQTGNLPVRCLVDNHDGRLAVGQTVALSIAVHQNVDVLSVPMAAVFDVGEGPVINVVRDGKTEHLHPHLGPSHDGWVAVSEIDLQPGELVVIEGGYNLKEETPVKIEGDEGAHDDSDTQ